MRHLGIVFMVGVVGAWTTDVSATVGMTGAGLSESWPAMSPATLVAKKKTKKKKKKPSPKKAETPPAEKIKAPTTTPPADETTPTNSDTSTSGGGGDWGSADWASPGQTGDKASSSSSSLLGGRDAADTEPAETVETKADGKVRSRYRREAGVAGAALILRAGYTGAGRNFTYTKATTPNLRPYKANFVSMMGGELETYPFVWLGISGLDALGLRGGYRQAIGLKSAQRADPSHEYSTTWSNWDAGLVGRLSIDDALLALGVSFCGMKFELSVPNGDPMEGQIQNIDYTYLRIGVDVRYAIGSISLMGGAAYRQVLGTGPLADTYFPKSSALGFDAHLGAAYQVLELLEVYLKGNFTQFMHSFDTSSTATYVADGASDMCFGGEVGVAVIF